MFNKCQKSLLSAPASDHSLIGRNGLISDYKPLSTLTHEDKCLTIAPKEVIHQDSILDILNLVKNAFKPPPTSDHS